MIINLMSCHELQHICFVYGVEIDDRIDDYMEICYLLLLLIMFSSSNIPNLICRWHIFIKHLTSVHELQPICTWHLWWRYDWKYATRHTLAMPSSLESWSPSCMAILMCCHELQQICLWSGDMIGNMTPDTHKVLAILSKLVTIMHEAILMAATSCSTSVNGVEIWLKC